MLGSDVYNVLICYLCRCVVYAQVQPVAGVV